MSDPFVAEIRIVGFNFAPIGWAFCNGQLMPISQNTALFSLIGTFYGGDGKSTFALPNLQGRAPMHQGQGPGLSNRDLGELGGEQSVTLITSELPAHSHQVSANTGGGNQTSPTNNVWSSLAGRTPPPLYSDASNTTMSPQAAGIAGSSQPHNNMPPYLTLNFIIALQGIFPPRN
ncbi:MAG TPA: tail fiber protein [Blastocatellia bacterium]|nr:tail fiber protein [Blastocatellia bacterium]